MKSIHYLLLLLTICMPGCVMLASDSSLDKSKVASLTHLYVVPIKGAPVDIDAYYCFFCQKLHEDKKNNAREAFECFLCHLNDGSLLNKKEIWESSNEVAKIMKHYLETVGNYSITIAPDVEPLPGIESWETNASLWEIPLKNWYNEETSSIDYSEQPDSDTVLEVSISGIMLEKGTGSFKKLKGTGSYKKFHGLWSAMSRFHRLWIVMKLVDTTTRSVLANARCYGVWPPPLIAFGSAIGGNSVVEYDPNLGVSGNADVYKRAFRSNAEITIPECIESLGLHKKL